MNNGPEEEDREAIALLKKLRPAPRRDQQTAANGKAKFLAEAREHKASVSAEREERHKERKEGAMRFLRIPVALLVIVTVGLVVVYVSVRTLAGANVYMSRSFGARPPTSSGAEIFVAGRNIPQGATITEDMLATISLPGDKVSAVEFTADKRSQLVGKVARFPLDQGTVITRAMVGNASPAMGMAPAGAAPSAGNVYGATTRTPKTPRSTANPQATPGAAFPVPPDAGRANQMIVKNADIRLLVEDTDRALDGVTQTVVDVQGYVLSSRTWYQDSNGTNYKYATLTIAVPVDQFENTLRRLRSLAVRVLDENASGQDVTNEYVDLQSQVTNLEATRDRIKSFLDQTTNVDEALRINQQLSQVEAQIEQLKGQMNYLSNRSAFSTITINLEPQLPKIVKTPRPTATPTPLPSLGSWDAGKTTQQATYTLVSVYRLIAKGLIWFFVVIVPVFGPPAVLVWLVAWLVRRRDRAQAKRQGV